MSLFQDWHANRGNTKGRLILLLFRAAQFASGRGVLGRLLGFPYLAFYRAFVVWGLGVELPLAGVVGPRLRLYHGQGLVVFDQVCIGADVTLRHCTTIGAKEKDGVRFFPTIEDGVDVGCNAVVLGDVVVGANATIGAGAVVTKSIPAGSVYIGNPAVRLR